jgi:hypothetical protein
VAVHLDRDVRYGSIYFLGFLGPDGEWRCNVLTALQPIRIDEPPRSCGASAADPAFAEGLAPVTTLPGGHSRRRPWTLRLGQAARSRRMPRESLGAPENLPKERRRQVAPGQLEDEASGLSDEALAGVEQALLEARQRPSSPAISASLRSYRGSERNRLVTSEAFSVCHL